MNTTIRKPIKGQHVSARPVFKGGLQPAYWSATVNEHSLPQVFPSPAAAFRFAADLKLS